MAYLLFVFISFYTNAREDPTTKSYSMSFSTKVMNITGETICDSADPSVSSSGQICWSYSGNATFSYTFKGAQFVVYGMHGRNSKFNLFVDNEYLGEIIETQNDKKTADLIYTSKVYEYGYHTIRAISKPGQYFEILKFAIWPQRKAKRLNISEMSTYGKWIKKSDEIGGTCEFSESEFDARKSLPIKASKLWIYGTVDPQFGKIQIRYNTLNLIIETNRSHQDCYLLFESEDMHSSYSVLDIIAIETKSVLLCCIYYLEDQINTLTITNESWKNHVFINKNYTNKLKENKPICINHESAISQISGCTFANIELENASYFIRLDKEILFYENSFEFSAFDYNPVPVYLSSFFRGKITVSRCTFIKCKSIESNANVLICNGEVDITIENSQFINCGGDMSHVIVKMNTKNEHLMNFTNCIFHFENKTSSCYVFETKYSVKLIFDHCKFIMCPIVKIDHKIHSLQFTYNVVDSANRMIIFINYLKFELNITSNVFKNNDLIGSEFITLNHDINEIAFINNTFSGITSAKTFEVFPTFLYFNRITELESYLIICECKFINIQNEYSAIQVGSASMTVNIKLNITKSEFIDNLCTKGNGGAFSVKINHELSITNCHFKNNKAFHHGGAISLYMHTKVEIISCSFEENIANYDSSSFMHDLKKGKGGAIYMYCHSMKKYASIEKCMFISNSALDGYAIYIKGDTNQQKLIIIQNTFNDNYDKNLNARNKGVITSKILYLDVDKIIFCNIFIPKEENKQRIFLYIDSSNQKKYKSEFIKYSYSRKMATILNLLFIFTLIYISIFITRNIDQDNTFVFVILGDQATKSSESFNEKNVKKYGNYCFTSFAILIKRLAIKHLRINEKHIGIFGKGQKKDFDISSFLQNNKIISQLTIDEIYETEISQSELNFLLFQNVEDLIELMRSFILNSGCLEPNIILFMYDHGDEHSFGNLMFLELYFGLLSIPHSSLHIYNESCKSNSMILKIKNYFKITEVINSFTPKITQDELFFLASIGNKLFPTENYSHWDSILELDNKYSEYNSQRKSNAMQLLLSLVFDKDKKYDKFPSNLKKKEIMVLTEIVKCYLLYNNIPTNYDEIHSIFTKGVKVIIEALKKFEITNAELMNILKDLKENKSNFAEEQYEMHPNHFIITSSHEKCSSPTFGTIKINEGEKIIAGSPAMGAYIIEALMNRSLSKNSVDNIKKIAYGDTEGFIREYATENFKIRTKRWVRLEINYWESKTISERKILLNQDINYMEIKDIMKSIGFKLIASCKLEFNEKNYCITTKMQPLFNCQRTPNFIGVRLIDINLNHDYSKNIFEEDEYYSDHTNSLDYLYSPNVSSTSSFENLLDDMDYNMNYDIYYDMDYDMIIPHKYIVKISYEAIKEYMVNPVRVVTVFEYELNEMSKNDKFINKYSSINKEIPEKTPYEFNLMIYNWIIHFFPTYELRELIDDFILLFYKFTVKFDIPTKDAEDIFYKCMNIADQVASQLSLIDKKKAYYVERLKK